MQAALIIISTGILISILRPTTGPTCNIKTNVYRSNPLSMFLETSTWSGLLLVSADSEGPHNKYHVYGKGNCDEYGPLTATVQP